MVLQVPRLQCARCAADCVHERSREGTCDAAVVAGTFPQCRLSRRAAMNRSDGAAVSQADGRDRARGKKEALPLRQRLRAIKHARGDLEHRIDDWNEYGRGNAGYAPLRRARDYFGWSCAASPRSTIKHSAPPTRTSREMHVNPTRCNFQIGYIFREYLGISKFQWRSRRWTLRLANPFAATAARSASRSHPPRAWWGYRRNSFGGWKVRQRFELMAVWSDMRMRYANVI